MGLWHNHPQLMQPIFLIGFMGAGKTTLGRALAERLPGVDFIDLDELIERRTSMSVKELFAAVGEKRFRQLEKEALAEVAARTDVIIGCGGGTPCGEGNMELMNSAGLTVLLVASHSTLLRRLLEAQDSRPLLAGLDEAQLSKFITAKCDERASYYGKARLRFRADLLENAAEIDESCREFMALISGCAE